MAAAQAEATAGPRVGGGARRPCDACFAPPTSPPACFSRLPPALLALASAAEGGAGSGGHFQSAAACTRNSESRWKRIWPTSFADTPRRTRRGIDPARLRALRLLHGDLPDLPAAGRRARRPARTHLPDQADARRRCGHRHEHAAAPRSLPELPQLRDDLPVGRALRPAARHRAPRRRDRESSVRPASARAAGCCARALTPSAPGSARRLPPAGIARPLLPRALAAKVPAIAAAPSAGRRRATRAGCCCSTGCVQPRAGAVDRCRARARARPGRHLARPGCGIRLLRRVERSSGRARRSARFRARATSTPGGRISSGGAEAIVVSASGCGVVVKDVRRICCATIRRTPTRRVASRRWRAIRSKSSPRNGSACAPQVAMDHGPQRVAFHSPCTLQHGQRLVGESRRSSRRSGSN